MVVKSHMVSVDSCRRKRFSFNRGLIRPGHAASQNVVPTKRSHVTVACLTTGAGSDDLYELWDTGSIQILQHIIFVLFVTTIIFVPILPPPYHREVVITLPAGQIGQIAGLPLCTRKPYLLQIWPVAVKQDKALASATKKIVSRMICWPYS